MARRFFSAPYFKAAEGMGYLTVVAIIFACIYAVCAALTLHYVFFTAVGIFRVKKFPAANEKCSYGIIIGARNEENVIAALIDSIKSCVCLTSLEHLLSQYFIILSRFSIIFQYKQAYSECL